MPIISPGRMPLATTLRATRSTSSAYAPYVSRLAGVQEVSMIAILPACWRQESRMTSWTNLPSGSANSWVRRVSARRAIACAQECNRAASSGKHASSQEELRVQRVALGGTESCIADDAPQLLFGGAIADAGRAHHVLLDHYRADIVATETQAGLADLQALRHPARLNILKVAEEDARDRQRLKIFDCGSLVPAASTKRSVLRLKRPGDERGEAAGLFLQFVDALEVVDAMLVALADAEHHGRRGPHAEHVSGAMHVEPVIGQAFQARDLVAHFIVENFGAATGNGIESGIAQPPDRIFDAQAADLGDADDLRRREAVQVDLRKALLDAAQQGLIPLDLQIRMQPALQQDSCATQLHGFAYLLINSFEIKDIAFFRQLAFERAIEGAEGAVLSAEIGVIDIPVDDVGDHTLGMQLAAHRIGFHAETDQVVGAVHLERFRFG